MDKKPVKNEVLEKVRDEAIQNTPLPTNKENKTDEVKNVVLSYLSVGEIKNMLKDLDDNVELRILSSSGLSWNLNKNAMSTQLIKKMSGEKLDKFTLYIK